MSYAPQFAVGTRIENKRNGQKFKIIDSEYSEDICGINYKIQHSRFSFNMSTMAEVVIEKNIENGDFEVIN